MMLDYIKSIEKINKFYYFERTLEIQHKQVV